MRRKTVQNILCTSINKITGKKLDNKWIQTCFLENERKEAMVKEWKKLRNVKGKGAG